jgi:dynein heavy chain
LASTGGGKTSDEIVYELADSIMSKLPDILDMEKAEKSLFEVRIRWVLFGIAAVMVVAAILKCNQASMVTINC